MIQIFCKNNSQTKMFPPGTSLLEMADAFEFEKPFQIVSARVNNVSQGLRFRAYNSKEVEFFDLRDPGAMHVYTRALTFLFAKACEDVLPGSRMFVEHPISNGFYCNIRLADGSVATVEQIAAVSARMREIVEEDIPFHRFEVRAEEAIRMFREKGYDDKVRLLETSGDVYIDYYKLGDSVDYFYGRLLPSTSYLKVWALEPFHGGVLLRTPDRENPDKLRSFMDQPKTFDMFAENLHWNLIMHLNTVGDVNKACLHGDATELIQVAEALQEKKIVQIAEEIDRRYHSENAVRVVLITGPSSSGKTTFCKRLCVQLKACGLRPLSFSTDDYFVNRIDTPKFPDGRYDFDNFDTVDHAYLQEDLLRMLKGEEVDVPEYNFVTGKREFNGKHLRMTEGCVLLVEGIHALNPRLTDQVPEECKFRIFINTLTSNSLDNHNSIPTSDNRLLRRIVRDYNKGAFTARETISQWPSVRKSEHQWIYPYQENADVMFNSAYLAEFAVMRSHAEPILATVPKNCPEYAEAHRLLRFMHYFVPVSDKDIPSTSLLRDFIGGSSF